MLLVCLFLQVLFLPLIYGGNNTAPHTQNTVNDTVPLSGVSSNKTNNILPTEGGGIPNINSNLTLLIKNTNLPEVDKEKTTSNIKPRKGVTPEEYVDSIDDKTLTNSTDVKDQIISNNTVNNTILFNSIKFSNNARVNSSIAGDVKTTVLPHKPTVLVYEALNHNVPPQPVPSSKTDVSNQIPNPNLDNFKIKNIEANQPGMIMPVVITILTVPLLVVLGYMALSRGREAWKNRHYKRMDFLLDGMYND
nr:uncharacterized protein LOC128669467 [Plodia interpunctella]